MRRFWTWLTVLGFVLAGGSFVMAGDPVHPSAEMCAARQLDDASFQARRMPPHMRLERGLAEPGCAGETNAGAFAGPEPRRLQDEAETQRRRPADRLLQFPDAAQRGACGRGSSDSPRAALSCARGTPADRPPSRRGGPGPTGQQGAFPLSGPEPYQPQDDRVRRCGLVPFRGAPGATSGQEAVTAAADGYISGKVTDAGSAPLENVEVVIYDCVGSWVTYAYTDSSGVYTTSGVPLGTYYARTYNSLGYLDELYDNISCPGGECTVTSGTSISVTSGTTTSGINFSLDPGGRISGTVTSSVTTLPLANMWVEIYNSDGSYVAEGYTDSSGVYTTYAGLTAGTYYARTYNSQGYLDELYNDIPCALSSCTVTSGTAISVTIGTTTTGIDFALAPGGRISGTVTVSGTSVPLANVYVYVYNSAGSSVTYGYTNGSGVYTTYAGLTAGTYYARTYNSQGYLDELYNDIPCALSSCTVTSGTAISVTAGTTTTGRDFGLDPGGRISGTVRDSVTALPLANVEVDIYNSAGNEVTYAYTNSSGVYTTYRGLPAGTYYARTYNSQGYLDELYDNIPCLGYCTVTGGTAISVTTGMTTPGIDFDLAAGGRISGTVTDAGTGLPLGGVYVEVYNSAGSNVTYAYADCSGAYSTYGGLPSGTYYALTYNSLGYLDELYNDVSCPFHDCTVTSGAAINVTAGETKTGIDFGLARGGRIGGTVTDSATSLPLPNVEVDIYNSAGSAVTYGYTNSSGVYTSYGGLPPGTYYALTYNSQGYLDELYDNVSCPFHDCTVTSGKAISVTAGTTTGGINFGLARGGRISGMVTDAASSPLGNVEVDIYNSAGNEVTYGYTDTSGVYTTYGGLPSGTYYARTWNSLGYLDELYNDIPCPLGACAVTSGTAISVTIGTTTTGIDFALAPGGRISGTVTDSVTTLPLANVAVDIYNSAGNEVTYAYTNSSGVYTTYRGLPSGNYYARTYNSQGYLDELYDNIPCALGGCTVTSGTAISVTAGTTTTGRDFALAAGGRISGTVTDAATSPLANVYVDVYNSTGSYVTYGRTNSSGVYTTYSGLPSGNYYARTDNSQGYLDELYNNIPCTGYCAVTSGTPISVTAGATTPGIDFALAAGGRISGTVTDAATSLALADVNLNIYNSAGNHVTYAYTNGSGAYTSYAGLPSGTYYALTWNSAGYIDELYNNVTCPGGSCSLTSGTPISVTAGATTMGIDFGLVAGGRISGTVTDAATGLPLDDVEVVLYDSAGSYVAYGYTNSSGVYTTYGGVPSGTYYARTWNWQEYYDELWNNLPCTGSCTVTSGTPISATAGTTTTGINFSLEPNPSLEFFTVTPCRVLDTRNPAGPLGGPALVAGTARTFTVVGSCDIPATAKAVSANVTVTQPSAQGNVRLYPAGAPVPLVSTINYVAGVTRANNAIVKLNASGQTSVVASPSGTVHFILDVNGYFQ